MDLNNFTGIILAATVFITVAFGHVFVRKTNYFFGTKPAILVFAIGIAMFYYSTMVTSNLFSSVLGITAMTIIWDGIELFRQENRIRMGHAPENPNRPVTNLKTKQPI